MQRINRSLFKPRPRGAYRIDNKAKDEPATVYLYDEISWFGISADTFVKDLQAIKAGSIDVRINSPGGSVFEGLAIYNALKNHPATITVHIDGLAASIASIIAMAGDSIQMAENAFLMIHEPWSMVIGGATELRKEADLLDKVAGQLVGTYASRTSKSKDEILDLMGAETWFTAQEALAAGFIDAINENQKAADLKTFDLSAFAHVPDGLQGHREPPTERDLERLLRDAGCSRSQAKAILAEGFKGAPRDAVVPEPEVQPEPRDAVIKPPGDAVTDLLVEADMLLTSILPSECN